MATKAKCIADAVNALAGDAKRSAQTRNRSHPQNSGPAGGRATAKSKTNPEPRDQSSADGGEQANRPAKTRSAAPALKSDIPMATNRLQTRIASPSETHLGKARIRTKTSFPSPSRDSEIGEANTWAQTTSYAPPHDPAIPPATVRSIPRRAAPAETPITEIPQARIFATPSASAPVEPHRSQATAASKTRVETPASEAHSPATGSTQTRERSPESAGPDKMRSPHGQRPAHTLSDAGQGAPENHTVGAGIGTNIDDGQELNETQTVLAIVDPASSGGQFPVETHKMNAAAGPELPSHVSHENQQIVARQTQSDQASSGQQTIPPAPDRPEVNDRLSPVESQSIGAIVDLIVELHRRRWDMVRARQRLELQAQAVCRRLEGGDKTKAAKMWAAVRKDGDHPLRSWLAPYLAAMQPLLDEQAMTEKRLLAEVRKLPVIPWAQGIRGLGELSLSAIIGECGTGPGNFRSVSALWKRMGLAVIDGGRQRRIAGEAAIEHGYNAQRRSIMWNIGDLIIRAQIRVVKDEDGEKTDQRIALGDLGQLYLDRKVYEAERVETAGHAHNRAKRYMEKRLLRMLWQAWRQTKPVAETSHAPSASEEFAEAAE